MQSDISLINNIYILLQKNYENNLIIFDDYTEIKSKINKLSTKSLMIIFNKLNYLNEDYKNKLLNQQNVINKQQNMINQQQNQINSIVNLFNNDFNLEDNICNEISNKFNNESNGRRSLINTQQEYLPRISYPQIQNKQPRNSFEVDYQQRFQQRNDLEPSSPSNDDDNMINTQNNNQDEININNINKNDFNTQETGRIKNFEKSQYLRKKVFEEKSRRRKLEFNKYLEDINNNLDPYSILGCSENCSIVDIKKSYKRLAMKWHPDRGGDSDKFNLLTKAYLSLIDKYKQSQDNNSFSDLKISSTDYVKQQDNNPRENVKMDSDNFNIETFNKMYTENRLSDVNDEGYTNWYKEGEDIDDTPIISSDKFNINIFNSVFENSKNDNNSNSIVEYKDPIPTNINNELAFNNLGEGNINDFSGNSNNLNYTDLKVAHTKTKLIDTNKVNIKNYKNIEDLEKDRSNISYKMSNSDLKEYNNKKRLEEMTELSRQNRLKQNDTHHFNNYNKVHKILIDNK
jgi:curved DNA-binding protein CbpA